MGFISFGGDDSYSYLKRIVESIRNEIMELEDEYVLKASQTELEDYFINKAYLCPLVLDLEAQYIKKYSSDSVDVPPGSEKSILWGMSKVRGTRVSIAIPYRGDKNLWRVQPSKFSLSGYPEIEVLNDEIIISVFFQYSSESSESVKSEIERQVSSIADAVEALRQDVENHNEKSIDMIKSTLGRRRQLAENTMGIIKGLGIPIKRQDEPLTYTLPTKRRASPLSRPPVSSEPYKPEPALAEAEYHHIIEILQSMGHSIERNARSFSSLAEQVLRDFFLLVLNGHYEGTATG